MKFFVFLKDNIGVIFFIFIIIAVSVALIHSVILEISLDSYIPSYGYVVSKDNSYGIFDDYCSRVEIGYDVYHKGKRYSRSKKYHVTTDQYFGVSIGDIIYFDGDNNPIFVVGGEYNG